MTPRSVQIWFQNRRQRLLKPMRQGENEAEDEMHLDSSAVRASSSGDMSGNACFQKGGTSEWPASSACTTVNKGNVRRSPISEQQQRDLESQYAKLAAQAFGPLVRGEQAAQSGALPMWRNISSNSVIGGWNEDPASYPFSLIPQAVASGQLAPNAAAMIMQALQQQMDVRHSTNVKRETLSTHVPAEPTTHATEHEMTGRSVGAAPSSATPRHTPPEAEKSVSASAAPSASAVRATPEGVDGLLLLSACADVQRQDSVDSNISYKENLWKPHFPSAAATNSCCPIPPSILA